MEQLTDRVPGRRSTTSLPRTARTGRPTASAIGPDDENALKAKAYRYVFNFDPRRGLEMLLCPVKGTGLGQGAEDVSRDVAL